MLLHRLPRFVLVGALLLGSAACRDDDGSAPVTSSSSTASTEAPAGDLERLLLTAGDLPAGFTPSDEVDDTITSFCATHDAAAGLQASERAVAGFARDGGGASVIQLVFRFEGDGAATFVAQSEAALVACSGVPDGSGTGLAFEYEPLPGPVEAALGDAGDARTGAVGTSVGSGSFQVEVAVLHDGDVGVLVAVLGLDEPQAALDELAAAAFAAVVDRLG